MSDPLYPAKPANRGSALLVDPSAPPPGLDSFIPRSDPRGPQIPPGPPGSVSPPPATPSAAPPPPIDEQVLRYAAASNPLLSAATPLLTLVCQLRGTARNDDVPRLQYMVSEEIKSFESKALQAESSPQDVVAARYLLCALIDETVLSTPWGGQSQWSAQTMLSLFHKETWSGEKVFVILDRIKAKPARYIHLLELIDVVLSLGFRGRFGVLENGLYQLEDLRSELWRTVRAQRDVPDRPLAPEPKVERVRRALITYVPLWLVFSIAALVMLMTFGVLQYYLASHTDTAAAALKQIGTGP